MSSGGEAGLNATNFKLQSNLALHRQDLAHTAEGQGQNC